MNNTNSTLWRAGSESDPSAEPAEPEAGLWEVAPPRYINPVYAAGHEGGRIMNKSGAAGTEGSVTYYLGGQASGTYVTFTWDNPFAGRSTFAVTASPRLQIRGIDQDGNSYFAGSGEFGRGNKAVMAFEVKLRETRPYLLDLPELTLTFGEGIDAAVIDINDPDKVWFFKGDQVMKIDTVAHTVVEDKKIKDLWPEITDSTFQSDISAAFMAAGTSTLSLIKSDGRVGLLNLSSRTFSSAGTVWENIGAVKPAEFGDTVDAVMLDPFNNDKIYLFSGSKSVRCNMAQSTCEAPESTAERWTGLSSVGLSDQVDAALSHPGKANVVLFHGANYVRLNIGTQEFDMDSSSLPTGTVGSPLCRAYLSEMGSDPTTPAPLAYPDRNFYVQNNGYRMGAWVGYLLYGCASE
ncbi:hemopexin repeat-containing protein [Streptomyces murinus]|uniref:hemopexin repeat-containing protein n=1 Tax=Streptomyces murinus TaxID=33900 RepID=UPI003F459A3B